MEFNLELGKRLNMKIELIGVRHYCRYCKKNNSKCLKRHRAGTVYIMRVTVDNETKLYIIGDGEIPPELTESWMDALTHRVSTSGWLVIPAVYQIDENESRKLIEKINQEPTEFDKDCLIKRMLGYRMRNIEALYFPPRIPLLTILDDFNVTADQITNPLAYPVKMTYRKWLDDREDIVLFRSGIKVTIERTPKSFKEHLVVYDGSDEYIALKFKKSSLTHKDECDRVTVYKRNIYRDNEEVLKAYYNENKVEVYIKTTRGIWGIEKYYSHLHLPCMISNFTSFTDAVRILHEKRLGDLLFVGSSGMLKLFTGYHNVHVHDEHLKKLNIINAEIEKIELKGKYETIECFSLTRINKELPIQVVHPEHGSLELLANEYVILRVPYIEAGHD